MKKTKKIITTILMSGISISAKAYDHGSASAIIQVSTTINVACEISVENISFGTVTPKSTGDATSSGNITSICSKSVPYTLSITPGNGTEAQRKMLGTTSSDSLNYNLYTDAAMTTIFGDNNPGVYLNLTGNGAIQTTTIYAKMPLNQFVTSDVYTDNPSVNLYY